MCTELAKPGDQAMLQATIVTEPNDFTPVGCVSYPASVRQGPLVWYRATLALSTIVSAGAPAEGHAEIHVRVGDFAVVIASVRRVPSGIELSSPTAGDTFDTTTHPVDANGRATLAVEITNYVQESSLRASNQPVTVGFREYGLNIVQARLDSGTLSATQDPPYPIAIALGEGHRRRHRGPRQSQGPQRLRGTRDRVLNR